MPILFSTTADFWSLLRYMSMASEYCFRAMKISPRVSFESTVCCCGGWGVSFLARYWGDPPGAFCPATSAAVVKASKKENPYNGMATSSSSLLQHIPDSLGVGAGNVRGARASVCENVKTSVTGFEGQYHLVSWSREFWLNCGADPLVRAGPPGP